MSPGSDGPIGNSQQVISQLSVDARLKSNRCRTFMVTRVGDYLEREEARAVDPLGVKFITLKTRICLYLALVLLWSRGGLL